VECDLWLDADTIARITWKMIERTSIRRCETVNSAARSPTRCPICAMLPSGC
jgi:hypothetical protein